MHGVGGRELYAVVETSTKKATSEATIEAEGCRKWSRRGPSTEIVHVEYHGGGGGGTIHGILSYIRNPTFVMSIKLFFCARILLEGSWTSPVTWAWIGLSDHVTEGKFQWDDGTPLTYTSWSPGQPKATTDEHDCVAMTFDAKRQRGDWVVLPCDVEMPSICERKITP